ncbi:MAG: GerAB/ArcD/ProY family transporter [Oscillospiraceae bacterium]
MEKTKFISQRQLRLTVLICLFASTVINPFENISNTGAQGQIIGMCINVFIYAIILFPIFELLKTCDLAKTLSQKCVICKAVSVVIFLLIAFDGVGQMFVTEKFYRYVSDNLLPIWLFIVLFVLVAAYGARMGLEPIVRTGLVTAVILTFSLALILVANISQLSLQNLQFANSPVLTGVKYATETFRFPTEWLVYGLLMPHINFKKSKSFVSLLPFFLAVIVALSFAKELVLGEFAGLQLQPLYTLARIGSISVFTRLDALHVCVWVMLAMFKVAVYFYILKKILSQCIFPKLKNKSTAICMFSLLLCTMLFYSFQNINFAYYTSFASVITAVLIIIILITKGVAYEKESIG